MVKVLQYLFLGLGKVIGPLWFLLVAVHFRKRARAVVHNHVLQNNLKHRLKRLWERKPELDVNYWFLTPFESWVNGAGAIYKIAYSKLELWALFWLVWVWLDDDSTSDTYDGGHAGIEESDSKYFDHGDLMITRHRWYPALRWNMRNTTMNFKYYFMGY